MNTINTLPNSILLFGLLSILIIALLIITGFIFYKIFSTQHLQEQKMNYLLTPLKESLEKFDDHLQAIEKARIGAYSGLSEQVRSLLDTQSQLRKETNNLVNALRKPHVRGRWGEIQLQRVVELAGMLEHCDFYQQSTVNSPNSSNNNSLLRPDLIIKLPGNKNIIVDAKVPLYSFLEALEISEHDTVAHQQKLSEHARHIRDHINKLSQKNYWDQFNPSPEFVILFLPGETFFTAALEADPALIEHGVEKQVIIATPTTLIALLKSIAYGWRQENLAQNAAMIAELGKELSKRLYSFNESFAAVGDKLEKTIDSYNKLIGTYESRILVTARKFQALNDNKESNLDTPNPITLSTRKLSSSTVTQISELNTEDEKP